MLEKTFRPDEVEARQYSRWEEAGAFRCDPESAAEPYAIMIPPPNVTGSLHMGHALNNTIQDILIRYHRMLGRDVLWQPGTDHAGIATQMVVERQLAERGIELDRGQDAPRGENHTMIGREDFIAEVWKWREESGGIILNQLRRLGASCDWERERFTMDEGLSRAVLKVFVTLHKEGLIYRDKRLVNWDPKFHTAISDLEVDARETKGHLWHFKYPIEGEAGRFITVATTRPETMLGDTAVAVHPDDERYRDLVGKHAILPLVGRRISIVADDYADPEQGSGAVKITPAHDFNDFEVGRRHDLPMVNILDKDANIVLAGNEDYLSGTAASEWSDPDWTLAELDGKTREAARAIVVEAFEARGLLAQIDDHAHTIPYGDRSGVVIEPWLTDQWFVDAATLAKPCIEAVEQGATVFVPKPWEKTYFEWMRNIQPWCVSRQLWWGHQIPAWYGPDGAVFVEESEDAAQAAADAHYGAPTELFRDKDVLDTWFSSALWPFSTIGWPDDTPELAKYYPGNVLVTGFDIIFFWVARMMMMGMHFMEDETGAPQVPFDTVYIHALVRDEKGQKMSKSKGNVLDPLDLVDKFGADAVRFTLAALAAQGRDIKMSESRIEGYRNFATKLWNAARYTEMTGATIPAFYAPEVNKLDVNRWIVSQLSQATRKVTEGIEAYRFNEAANEAYHFTWHTFCDWYLEFTKPILQGDDEDAKEETAATTLWVLRQILVLLHPFMPFITEELWQQMGDPEADMLIVSDWPQVLEGRIDERADVELGWVVRLITQIRAVRAEMNVPPGAKIPLVVKDAGEGTRARFAAYDDLVRRLARISDVSFADAVPAGAIQDVLDEATLALPLAEVIDLDQEKARLAREIEKVESEIAKLDKKLSNESFLAKAPAEVVEEQRERKAEYESTKAKLAEALKRLAAV